MTKPVSRVKFALRFGGDVGDPTGSWTYFDDTIGYIEDWSGLLSEGPVGGDIIEQDWSDGALWQQGVNKTYSFDVPYTALVPKGTIEPNIWESYSSTLFLKNFRGPQLTMRREFTDASGNTVRRDQAVGVLATDLSATVGIGRVINSVAVFQNLTGYWSKLPEKTETFVENFTTLSTTMWAAPTTGFGAINSQCTLTWEAGAHSYTLKTEEVFDLLGSSVIMEALAVREITKAGGSLDVVVLTDKDTGERVSFRLKDVTGGPTIYAYTDSTGTIGEGMLLDPRAHRWLKISEVDGALYWHVSGDRVSWTQLEVIALKNNVVNWSPYKVHIGLYATGSFLYPGVANFANINTTVPRPMLATLTDTFPASLNTSRWSVYPATSGAAGGISTAGGTCTFTWGNSTVDQSLTSKPLFDLRNSSVYLKLVSIIDQTGHPLVFRPLLVHPVGVNAGGFLGFEIAYVASALQISAVGSNVGVPLILTMASQRPYVPANHLWLRISESGGNIIWNTSSNGTTWNAFASWNWTPIQTSTWDPSAITAGADLRVDNVSATPVRVMEIDNININTPDPLMQWTDYPATYTWADHPAQLTWDDLTDTSGLESP